jgi:5-methyltetrahydropteroyltriglutamate--homocysteine methyltransferase
MVARPQREAAAPASATGGTTMTIPTEPIGSIPRTTRVREALQAFREGSIGREELDRLLDQAVRDTVKRFERTGSPVITDGEQAKPSFATYPVHGMENLAPDGVVIRFADGHRRQLPRLTSGPFRYRTYASSYLARAARFTGRPLKQAVISASALSLLYPEEGIPGYSREDFLRDLVNEAERDIRGCLGEGAHVVQIDFTEGRLAVKLDPSGELLRDFVALNNRVLDRFAAEERRRIGVHTCPGGDRDSTHSADVDYTGLLPELFKLNAGCFYLQLSSERDRQRVLEAVSGHAGREQRLFVGVIDPIYPGIETPETVRERTLEAAGFIDPERLGTTDDCGFSPFGDDTSTARDIAFAKIKARVEGTRLAADRLGA